MALAEKIIVGSLLFICACSNPKRDDSNTVTDTPAADSVAVTAPVGPGNIPRNKDTVFQTALPPVFDGDIIFQNSRSPEAKLLHELTGGKYNHVGIIFQRKKDGLLMVTDMKDTLRMTPLTEWVAAGEGGHVCLMRLKESDKTLNEKRTVGLREAAKKYRGKPFDPVLNWDDAAMYSSEVVWKIYDSGIMLKLCPTKTVADFDISPEKQNELNAKSKRKVSEKDEAVSPEDIYKSTKLEIIYEK